jgi:hypothetical protein
MKKVFCVLFFVASYLISYSQYTGGKGDGYSSIESKITLTAVNQLVDIEFYESKLVKKGEFVNLYTTSFYELEIVNLQGQLMYSLSLSEKGFFIPSNLQEGMYLVFLKEQKHLVKFKIIVDE